MPLFTTMTMLCYSGYSIAECNFFLESRNESSVDGHCSSAIKWRCATLRRIFEINIFYFLNFITLLDSAICLFWPVTTSVSQEDFDLFSSNHSFLDIVLVTISVYEIVSIVLNCNNKISDNSLSIFSLRHHFL